MCLYSNYSKEEYEKEFGTITHDCFENEPDISSYERETSIVMNDDEDDLLISSSQKPIMKKLVLDHKYFRLEHDGLVVKDGKIVCVNGRIPKNCLVFSENPRKDFGRI